MTIALEKPNQQSEINQPVDQNTVRRRGIGLRAYNPAKAFNGYTLFTPLTGQGEIYLIDIEGNLVHEWKLPYLRSCTNLKKGCKKSRDVKKRA
ncbi:PH domain-containing protein [Pseudanabaena yagii]|uniref:hypothetical protein n=1 Tax=Pseudanabaena yagii TaxID=2661615 RepID=UPI001B7D1582|nr:hypothetical protein [Pseudanabaena yagii]